MAKFVQTAVVSKEDGSLVELCKDQEALSKFDGREDVTLVTKKSFQPTELHGSWGELTGKEKPVSGDKQPRKVQNLSGAYHVTSKLKVAEEDARNVFAIPMRDNTTFEDYFAAVGDTKIDLPSSRNAERSNMITGSSYIRYALQRGWIALGDKPEEASEEAASA